MAKAPVRRRDGAADGFFKRDGGGRDSNTVFCELLATSAALLLDEVGDDLGVGFGDELVALGEQFGLEGEVVFDDAVVDDDEGAGAVAMGVGVFFRGAAVGGPAGVADAEGAGDGAGGEGAFRGCGACRERGGVRGRRGPPAMAMPAES